MRKRQKSEEGGASWMDTYGDMVTLLLCFFVLLYSISSVDQAKWENLVKSLNPDVEKNVSQLVTDISIEPGDEDIPGSSDLEVDAERDKIRQEDFPEGKGENAGLTEEEQKKLDEEFDGLYEDLQGLKELADDSTEVEIAKGEGYTFITFRDKVFFNGDSWVMRDEGKKMMDEFAKVIKPCASAIKQIQVLGHTSQGSPDKVNDVETDRELSAMRGAVVTSYLQKKDVIDPSKLVSIAYGQFHPIASFDTVEDRAKNRRVEILITKTGDVERSLDAYYEQVYGTNNE